MESILPQDITSQNGNTRRKLSEQARDWIRERIVSDEFAFGRPLRESDLSARLNMSKSPIREALLELAQEGLVVMSPNRPARVITLDSADVRELGFLRNVLETQAVRLAIARDPAGLAQALERITRQGAQALEKNDIAAFSSADHDFHMDMFRRCGNSYLEKSFLTIASRIQCIRMRLTGDPGRIRRSHATHLAILDAVRDKDADYAADLLSQHIRSNVEDYAGIQSDGALPGGRRRVRLDEIERFAARALAAVQADRESTDAIVRALSHASLHGVDSHGYRLLPHYLTVLEEGRVKPAPTLQIERKADAVAVLDAGDGHGARATYAAVEAAVAMAAEVGVGAIAIRNSSHFGAAGAYALAIAEAGMVGLCVCNSDPFVRLHGGAERFHGTNPIAFAASAGPEERPWLFDMATSAIPFNKVQLAKSLGMTLPIGTASDGNGIDTVTPALVEMLAPLGGAFGYKGAGLAGISEILSTALSDSPLSRELTPMISDDMQTPRALGAFVLALDPEAFMGRAIFEGVIRRYRDGLRSSTAAPLETIMAAGDREWAEADRRRDGGIVLDETTVTALNAFAVHRKIAPLAYEENVD
ncbi:LDH2 family malate/lactate/ureidoglycolate dehydrogenase/DNA-binding GntR family transcriptional regulator [Roseovarius sp. MBR-154]|jgi:LDH2 family malate/lactate/ureidoglycolate dehydrogenase/DNA-binding GntR family transcriptional regulator